LDEHIDQIVAGEARSMTVNLDDDEQSLTEAMNVAFNTLLRVNAMRAAKGLPAIRARAFTLALAEAVLDDHERGVLQTAKATGYQSGPPFQSAMEVRMFFRLDVLSKMMKKVPEQMLAAIPAMADVVIKSRSHCEF